MQVTVYIPKEMEPGLLGLAEANNQTIQQVLLTPWKTDRMLTKSVEEKLDGINEQLTYISGIVLGLASKPNRKEANPEKYESHQPSMDLLASSKFSPGLGAANSEEAKAFNKQFEESKIITKGSSVEDIKELDAKITAHQIKTKKGPVKANAAMESFFAPQPKAKWKGAK